MSADQGFVHILEAQLAKAADAPRDRWSAETRVATQAFWGVPARAPVPRLLRTHLPASRPHLSHRLVERDGSASTSRRARGPRPLTPTERDALRQLQHLGGTDLDPHFSDRQLRRVFRALAKRFHPDHHPGSSSLERERLAGTFATVVDAYRELTRTLH